MSVAPLIALLWAAWSLQCAGALDRADAFVTYTEPHKEGKAGIRINACIQE